MSADEVCPVCRLTAPGGEGCERCHDLRAAARAAAAIVPLDKVLLALLAGQARGDLRPEQVERAMAEMMAAEPPRTGSAGVIFALTRLVAGKTGAIAFVEIGTDTVSLQTLVVDPLGVPDRLPGESRTWPQIVPSLPPHLGLRYLRMAGGVGRVSGRGEDFDPGVLAEAVGSGIANVLARFKAAAAEAAAGFRADWEPDDRNSAASVLDTVLVRRTHDWPLLEAAAARARAVLRPITEIMAAPGPETLDGIVHDVAARVPLRYGYDLIGVEVEEGMVSPRPHELFRPGVTVPLGTLRDTVVAVSPVKGYSAERVVLPIVVRRGAVADLRDAKVLEKQRPLAAMADFGSAAEGPFPVRVELQGPGRLRLLTPEEPPMADANQGDWPWLMADLPERLETRAQLPPGSLDLVLLVELGGVMVAVKKRVDLARGVVRQLRGVARARVAVLGYRDHFGGHEFDQSREPGQERRALIVGSTRGFGPPDALHRILDRDWWHDVKVHNDDAAPVEDALWLLAHDWNWQHGARHVVLIVGSRPPHPIPDPRARIVTCRNGFDWRVALERLRDRQAVECFAVLDDDPKPGYAEETWQALTAPRGWMKAGPGAKAPALARACCGLGPRSRVRIRLATVHRADTRRAPGPERAR